MQIIEYCFLCASARSAEPMFPASYTKSCTYFQKQWTILLYTIITVQYSFTVRSVLFNFIFWTVIRGPCRALVQSVYFQ